MLELRSAREPTFVLSTLTAGFFARVAINATPFLLPLMFQIGFQDSAFKAGLMLLAYMGGNLAMKAVPTWLLKQHGFRRVLVWNGLGAGATIAACGLLTPGWPIGLVCVVLVLAGMTRSMQFTALNTIAFADIPASARSGATTLSAMSAQVASAAERGLRGADTGPGADDGRRRSAGPGGLPGRLLVAGALMAASSLWMMKLAHDAGAAMTAKA